MAEIVEIPVGAESAGLRLDIFLASRLEDLSRSRLKLMIEAGAVRVEGAAAKPGRRLAGGERIAVQLPGPEEESPRPEPLPLELLYRDESIAVINKPPGLLVHPVRRGQGGTLVNALLYHLGSLPETGSPLRPGIVHRLDRDTSGVMIAARTGPAYLDLVQQFRDRTVEKEYLALVRGRPPREAGECLFPIGRSPKQRTTMAVRYAGGRPARTIYRLEEEFAGYSLLRLVIKTGRTHQIRVHLSRLGCPVLGDPVYGKKRGEKYALVPRQMLHAHCLGITHPAVRRRMKWTAPIPGDMEEVISRIRRL
ncbi:MAG: RluA family pseudouridine synthase [Candidatus Erginobacter occultus]|nr:RluA family pseudouridine synthase [Candidatus Erginobacter occultus]